MLQWLTGYSEAAFHASESSVELTQKTGESTTWAGVCKFAIPPSYTCPVLQNGHVQTVRIILDRPKLPIYYKRWMFQQKDKHFSGRFAVDFVAEPGKEFDGCPPTQTIDLTEDEFSELGSLDAKPMLVVLHGMNGGSHESYLRRTIMPFVCDGGGWEACIVNSRGCAGSQLEGGLLYNARSTWDYRQTVNWLRDNFPNRPLFGLGFSMGGNILIHYLSEEGASCPLTAAVSCSNPWNLEVLSQHLQGSFLMRETYSRALATGLKRFLHTHERELVAGQILNRDEVGRVRYLHEMDRAIHIPMWNYPTETLYYREASSVNPLLRVRIPLLALNAEDDPLSPRNGLPIEEAKYNPYVTLVTTTFGGHLGWFQYDGERWFVQAVHRTLQHFWENIVLGEGKVRKPVDIKDMPHRKEHFCHKCGRFCDESFV